MLPQLLDLPQGGSSLAKPDWDPGLPAELNHLFFLGCLPSSSFVLRVSGMAPERERKEEVCQESTFSGQ